MGFVWTGSSFHSFPFRYHPKTKIVKRNFKQVVEEAKNNNELEKLKASLLFICDAPDDQRENIKKGVKELKQGMKKLLDGKMPSMFKK